MTARRKRHTQVPVFAIRIEAHGLNAGQIAGQVKIIVSPRNNEKGTLFSQTADEQSMFEDYIVTRRASAFIPDDDDIVREKTKMPKSFCWRATRRSSRALLDNSKIPCVHTVTSATYSSSCWMAYAMSKPSVEDPMKALGLIAFFIVAHLCDWPVLSICCFWRIRWTLFQAFILRLYSNSNWRSMPRPGVRFFTLVANSVPLIRTGIFAAVLHNARLSSVNKNRPPYISRQSIIKKNQIVVWRLDN